MVWRLIGLPPLPPSSHSRLVGMRVLLLGGEQEGATAVERKLKAHGAQVQRGGAGPVDAIVDLTAGPAARTWREAFAETVTALRGVYDDWATETAADRLFYLAVTYLGGGMGQHPDDAFPQPLGGIWAGLAKTLHREFPNCTARVADVGPESATPAELPGIVAAELGRRGEVEVGYRDGRRFTLTPVHEPVPRPAVRLGPSDTVLVSGGGRGIGWQLARTLAREHGVRVVVTGRDPLSAGDEPWCGADGDDEAAWQRYQRRVWARREPGRSPALVRRDLARTRSRWELAANLAAARREGLRVEYARCDVTDPAQVRALVARERGTLTGVVHNAGVDSAARLPKKTDEEILRTVEVKIDGFRNLFEAVREARGERLKFFCAVGSLTGRLGGMVGQLEYAAANDGLARLGNWAARRVGFPVMTLAWPTWDRIGLIANFDATLRYMAAIDVADGLSRWRAELLAGSRGEVSFVGPLGRAISPVQAVGYPVVSSLPGFAASYPRIFHLGEVTAYEPHARLDATVTFDRDHTPALGDFRINGVGALPVGVLLENAVRGAEWVVPEDFPALRLACLQRIVVPLSLLRPDGDGRALRLVREVRGAYEGRRWVVEVAYRRSEDDGGPGARASLRLVYERGTRGHGKDGPGKGARTDHEHQLDEPGTGERWTGETHSLVPPRSEVPQTTTLRSGPPFLHWRSAVVPVTAWAEGRDGRAIAEVVPACAPNDLWATDRVPHTALPVAALENVVRRRTRQGARFADGLTATVEPLIIGRIAVYSDGPGATRIEGDPALGVWRVTDARSGDPVMTVSGFPGPIG